jgi:gliding motility-associated-like protein
MKHIILNGFAILTTLISLNVNAQLIIYEDMFNVSNTSGGANTTTAVVSGSAPNNTWWRYTEFENSFGPSWAINNQEAVLQNEFGVNRSFGANMLFKAGDNYYTAPGGLYEQTTDFDTRFRNNTGIIEWTINFRSPDRVPSALTNGGAGLIGGAFVLGMSSPTLRSCSMQTFGYAVIFGDAIAGNYVKLVRFLGGTTDGNCATNNQPHYTFFTWNGTNTTTCIISDNETLTRDWYSVKVQYNPSNDEWRLFVRRDGTSKGDPQTLNETHCKGVNVDGTYTSNRLYIMGMYACLPDNSALRRIRWDNLRIKKDVAPIGCPSTTGLCGAYSICDAPVINTQPSNIVVCSPGSGNLIVSASTGPYQWQYNNGGTWQNVADGTPSGFTYTNSTTNNLTLTTNANPSPGTFQYRVVLGSGSCQTISNTVTVITAGATRLVPLGPQCSGTALNFEAFPASGATYSWIVTPPPGTSASPLSGTGQTFSFTPTNNTGTDLTFNVRAEITVNGVTCIREFNPTVLSIPNITLQPANTTICSDGSAILSVTASSGPYQWQFNNGGTWQNVTDGTPSGFSYLNSTTQNLTINSSGALQGDNEFRVVAGNTGCSNTSSVAIVTVPGGVRLEPSGQQCSGTQLNFQALPAGASYSWTVTPPPGTSASPLSGSSQNFSTTPVNTTGATVQFLVSVDITLNGVTCTRTFTPNIRSIQSGIDVQSSCGPYTWIDGIEYTSSTNTPTFTIPNGAANGCDSLVTLNLTITPAPSEPTLACYETLGSFNTTTCAWEVTGTQDPEPATACYETATFNTTTCAWEVTGTQDPEPATACYETATFNTTTCTWEVTGTQDPEPATACYETATFNTTTCTWEVTGTQDPEPATACYETATFNTTTCAWEVTGTQDPEPATACYETAIFNTTTCAWEVTGTQDPEPATACYETATFNTTICTWEVTGTQDPEPATACYETATFNTTTCAWEVTGTQDPEPATACYETATFNTTICTWEVTGTQDPEPATACYETATFNTTTCAWEVTGTQDPEPATACNETVTFNTTTCAWEVTGTQDPEPATACYETAIFNTTTCAWEVTGTQDPEPATACYETATFNTTTCTWEVTGTQDPEPATACYETATFNTTTCAWEVTGTQDPEPATACYETATFNTTTCAWEVTGTQDPEPATACYETATFNTTTCAWEVTGTQDPEPATACYETAIFNTTTCAWEVTGTQDPEPATACYETATFNTTTCTWEVTGTQDPEPATACYETAIFNTTTCAWEVTGTQDPEPATACYETATFNTTICTWEVTGTQDPEPATACYETATFNTTTCAWEVTGTQDPEPATACNETVTFNTTTCAWEVAGTQDPEPATACYETATFNTTTCAWEVTGTQDPEPATACYETATFNTTTCTWEVTGTQDPEPATACYETATFNTTTCAWEVTGTQDPEPATACYETATFNTTTCAWEVTGTQDPEPATACYETVTFNTTTCAWEVTGTQDPEPATACYETATFNTTTCAWEVTGTQPVQPTLACYETATFNTTTCAWEVSGTQPVQPTLACYETATFNTTTCAWEVTGTQPVQPTLACYETATFNSVTCVWDVTGTQPAAPTGLACYETATFNDVTCVWDVTGTQPTAPTGLACYETATFNDATCAWDITGSQPAAPTGLACYESATFNSVTCVWEVTGTPPAAPTGLACYETATFNTTTCQWDVTGNPPIDGLETRTTCDPAEAGTVVLTLTNAAGCDSLHTITTTLLPTSSTTATVITCNSSEVGVESFVFSNQFGCDSVHTITTEIGPEVTPLFNALSPVCQGAAVPSLPAVSLNGISGTWSPAISTGIAGNFTYTFIPDGGQCAGVATLDFTVNEAPLVVLEDTTVIRGTLFNLNSEVFGNSPFTYEWQRDNSLSCTSCIRPVAGPNNDILYYLTVTDVNGCVSRDSMLVRVDGVNLFIPDAFTPNGDGVNDIHYVYGGPLSSMKIIIFNRWGEKIFESTDQNFGWDGTYMGKLVNPGVYVYYFEGEPTDGSDVSQKGSITVIR